MAIRPHQQSSDRPAAWPAWCASLAIHAALFAATLYLARHQPVRGAAEDPSRDVGIVLKRMTDEGPLFEGEDDPTPLVADNPVHAVGGDTSFNAWPAESELPRSDSMLPQLPILGTGAVDQGEIGDAASMTRGGDVAKRLGGKATVRLFGIEGIGAKFVYVFDRSISMEGPPLRAAKAELVASLVSLNSVHQFQIVFFNHEPLTWDITAGQKRIAFATDRNKQSAENFVRSISASGGTSRRAALQLALRLRPDVIFFLTDTDDPMPGVDVADAIRRAGRHATAINTIEFGEGPARSRENFLVKLAHDTNGRYAYVDTMRFGK